jgi:hypothetical protein
MKLPDTAYVLVGRCLAPALTNGKKQALADALARPEIRWEDLLAEANRQHATPLWYVRLAAHGLLGLLPKDLQTYLAQLTAANRARNRQLKTELAAIARLLAAHDIAVLLLKGAATFADGLYADDGARLMSDLDLLIPEDQVHQAQQLLIAEGYVEDPGDRRKYDAFPLMARHSHLASLHHPAKTAVIELHYRVAYGQSGRVINAEEAWEASMAAEIDGTPVRVLSPTLRLLHNALHAALPHLEFLRGRFALQDLAEFAALAHRYGPAIDRAALFERIERHRLHSEFATYARISHLLMRTGFKLTRDISTVVHTRRILMIGRNETPSGLTALAQKALAGAYYFSRLPKWTWQNVVYGDEHTSNWRRFGGLIGGFFDSRFRQNAKL